MTGAVQFSSASWRTDEFSMVSRLAWVSMVWFSLQTKSEFQALIE